MLRTLCHIAARCQQLHIRNGGVRDHISETKAQSALGQLHQFVVQRVQP